MHRLSRPLTVGAILAVAIASLFIALWARGRRNVVLEGTLQWGFEQSAFFPDGDCSKKPFWWEWPNQHDNDLNTKWQALGKPDALRVKMRGNVTRIGMYGHLGQYRREVQPVEVISVSPASRCRWLGGH